VSPRRAGACHRRRQFGTAGTSAARRPHPGDARGAAGRYPGAAAGDRGSDHDAGLASPPGRRWAGARQPARFAAPRPATVEPVMIVLRLLSRTKLYWGLAALFLIGVA